MEQKITNNSGVFEISGNIIAENASLVKDHFEKLINRSDKGELIISLDRIESIDISGVNALATLYKKAIKSNTALYIIGKQNRNIKEIFSTTKMDFILSRDFV